MGFFVMGIGDSVLIELLVAAGVLQNVGKLLVDRIRAVVCGEEPGRDLGLAQEDSVLNAGRDGRTLGDAGLQVDPSAGNEQKDKQ